MICSAVSKAILIWAHVSINWTLRLKKNLNKSEIFFSHRSRSRSLRSRKWVRQIILGMFGGRKLASFRQFVRAGNNPQADEFSTSRPNNLGPNLKFFWHQNFEAPLSRGNPLPLWPTGRDLKMSKVRQPFSVRQFW